ncbi:hypothetical protein, partial [Streptomyces thermospinosisporus]|uniref:hypothetical protein n=1 Tax=Streptomyces thermospinosisporus TaxID=161482 RepID=UPI0031D74CE4
EQEAAGAGTPEQNAPETGAPESKTARASATEGQAGDDRASGQEVTGAGAPERETAGAGTAEPETAGGGAEEPEAAGGRAAEPEAAGGRAAEAETAHAQAPEQEGLDAGAPEYGAGRAGAGTTAAGHPDAGPGPGSGSGSSSRRRSPALIASVAAAVLLIGGGGAYLATSLSGGSGTDSTPGANGDATPPPLTLDGHSESGAPGIAPGEPNPYGAVYRADGALPEGPGSAPVYRTRGEVTEAQVTELARALGLDGAPVADGQGWRIGGKDGSGPTLRVDRAAPGSWSFSRHTPGTDNCKGPECGSKPPAAGEPRISEAAAKKAAVPVLKAAGQDDAKIDASQSVGSGRMVNAQPEIGGLPTHGWTTGLVVGADGEITGGSGRLAKPVKGDTYPVVSAERALELMNAAPRAGARGGIGGCATPVPLDGEQTPSEPCEAVTSLPEAPKKDTLTVEKAVFGLAAHSVDGRQALVPSWLFEVRPKGASGTLTVTHPAVEPKYIEQPGQSSAEPGEPGDKPTAKPSDREVAVEGYTAEGSELTVVFSGGVCADYDVRTEESGDRVEVTVTESPWAGKVCIMIAKQYQMTVRLDAPLGDRKVVGADGEPVPLHKDGSRLPAPPTQKD